MAPSLVRAAGFLARFQALCPAPLPAFTVDPVAAPARMPSSCHRLVPVIGFINLKILMVEDPPAITSKTLSARVSSSASSRRTCVTRRHLRDLSGLHHTLMRCRRHRNHSPSMAWVRRSCSRASRNCDAGRWRVVAAIAFTVVNIIVAHAHRLPIRVLGRCEALNQMKRRTKTNP